VVQKDYTNSLHSPAGLTTAKHELANLPSKSTRFPTGARNKNLIPVLCEITDLSTHKTDEWQSDCVLGFPNGSLNTKSTVGQILIGIPLARPSMLIHPTFS